MRAELETERRREQAGFLPRSDRNKGTWRQLEEQA